MTEDNTVLIVAVLAVIASLAAAGFSYYSLSNGPRVAGFATSTGSANLTVESSLEINFTDALINWQSGKVQTGKTFAVLDTQGTVFQGNWTVQNDGLQIENIGNVNVSLNLKSGKDAAGFIGGTSPSFKWKFTEDTQDTCGNATPLMVYADVNTTGIGTLVCKQMDYQGGHGALMIDINISIPYNSQLGALSDVITATASTAI